MKYIIILFTTIFAHMSHAQQKVSIGMTMEEVAKIYPGMDSLKYEKSITFKRAENLNGLDGNWGYRFEDNKLNWIHWDKYIEDFNDSNFKTCLHATRKLIEDYSNQHGKPNVFVTGDTTFVDPYVKHHWGYDVLEARWNDANGMKIAISFTFFGGKGEYKFIVDINHFDKEYPYYK